MLFTVNPPSIEFTNLPPTPTDGYAPPGRPVSVPVIQFNTCPKIAVVVASPKLLFPGAKQ